MEHIPQSKLDHVISGLQLEELWQDYVHSMSQSEMSGGVRFAEKYPLVAHLYKQIEAGRGEPLDPRNPPTHDEVSDLLSYLGDGILLPALEQELARGLEQAHYYYNERLIRETDPKVLEALLHTREDGSSGKD